MSLSNFNSSVKDYARGKAWYWYLPVWLIGIYAFYELFMINMAESRMPVIWLVPYSFDFAMHEIAHIVTAWLPPVLTASAGSGSELLLGCVLIVMTFWQRSYFASLVSCLWFGLACQSAGQYMADAIPQRIPLVSLGGALSGQDPVHDWHFVFGQLHMLGASAFIGNSIRFVGMAVGAFSILFTAWVMIRMSQVSSRTNDSVREPVPEAKAVLSPEFPSDNGFTSLPIDSPVATGQPAKEAKPPEPPSSQTPPHSV